MNARVWRRNCVPTAGGGTTHPRRRGGREGKSHIGTTIVICPPELDVERAIERSAALGRNPSAQVKRVMSQQELERLLSERARGDTLEMATAEGTFLLPCKDVILANAVGHRYRVLLADGRELCSRTSRCSFAENIKPLLDSGDFYFCRAAMVMNRHWIEKIQNSNIHLSNGMDVPVGARWRVKLQKALSAGRSAPDETNEIA